MTGRRSSHDISDLDFIEKELEKEDARQKTVGMFVTKAKQTTMAEFWKDHAEGELKTSVPQTLGRIFEPLLEDRLS